MESEDKPVDLSVLDPQRNGPRFEATVSRIAQRAIEVRRLRRAVVRRGVVALTLAMAAGLALWFSAPKPRPHEPSSSSPSLLDWATSDIGAGDVLDLGVSHAH